MPFMSPLRKLYNLCIRVRAILPAMHHATPSVTGTDELSTLVNRAYELLVDKLGSPSDSGVPMYVSYGALTICIRSRRGRYYIFVTEDPGWSIPVRVAHEVYHRITFNTIGTWDEVWVDEMMAMRASDCFLRCQKLQYEAAFMQAYSRYCRTDQIEFNAMRGFRRSRWLFSTTQLESTAQVAKDWQSVGYALEYLLGFECLVQLNTAKSFDAWLSKLTTEQQAFVNAITGDITHASVSETDCPYRLAYALFYTGRFTFLEAHLEKCLPFSNRESPKLTALLCEIYVHTGKHLKAAQKLNIPGDSHDTPTLFSHVGLAYMRAGCLTEASVCYSESLRLGPNSPEVLSQLGDVYLAMEAYEASATAYSQAITLSNAEDVELYKSKLARCKQYTYPI